MKNQAFTLIELLVVVLIIGVLTSIAVPKYQFAVEKSRTAEILTRLKALAMAERAYFTANGAYTNDYNKLDLTFKDNEPNNKAIVQNNIVLSFTRLTNNPPYIYGYIQGKGYSDNNHRYFLAYVLTTGEIFCEVHNTAVESVKRMCKSFGPEVACPKESGTASTCYKVY